MAYQDHIGAGFDGHDAHISKGIVFGHGAHFHIVGNDEPLVAKGVAQ